jgi:hypothetical protein
LSGGHAAKGPLSRKRGHGGWFQRIALTNGKLEQDNSNRRSAASCVWPGIDVILTKDRTVLERVRPGAGRRSSAQTERRPTHYICSKKQSIWHVCMNISPEPSGATSVLEQFTIHANSPSGLHRAIAPSGKHTRSFSPPTNTYVIFTYPDRTAVTRWIRWQQLQRYVWLSASLLSTG